MNFMKILIFQEVNSFMTFPKKFITCEITNTMRWLDLCEKLNFSKIKF